MGIHRISHIHLFAGDEIYISLDTLADYGLIKQSSVRNFNKFSDAVDFEGFELLKSLILEKHIRLF